jgi:ABC-type nitrate/sulfonate/bicarbonate transport system substrate-binding protein
MTEYWNGGITSMNRSKSFLGVVWLAGFALVAQNAFALGLAKDQVVPLNIGGKLARVEALLGNKVPAAIWDPPYTTMAAKEGYKLLVDLAPMDVPYLRNIVAVSEKSLREDSRTMSRFVAARAEGMQFNRNKSKILAKYLRMPLERNRAMIEEGYGTYRQTMLKKPYTDPSAMKILTAMIAETNPKARNIDPASLVDSSFVVQLEREGVFDR